MEDSADQLVERLTLLGFSRYDARAYVGLLLQGEQTGYALANTTGVPQPKIYETLRRLSERGAVTRTSDHPARYVAVPASTVLAVLERDFSERIRAAKDEAARLPVVPHEESRGRTRGLAGRDQVLARATAAVGRATRKVYLSGRWDDLAPLADAVHEALARDVTFVIMHFGPLPFDVPGGSTFRHASTEGTLYPSHKAHHLAVVADSTHAVWAVARDGVTWEGIAAEDGVFASVVKGFVRHDIMIQRIYADFPEPLTELYGPGLLELGNVASGRDEAMGFGDEEAAV
ncbi:MAG: TrmB family transcriptional regulator [Chloroflexi bacterium]|nr:TrmB family transcriptional regulator [Chloroflexota bacterium]